MSPRPQPIVALDVQSLAEARTLVDSLGPRADFYKVGLQLFSAEGPAAVEWLRSAGKRVFLDLKLHDIPSTVRKAAASAARLDATLLTVHGLGGEAMVRAAVEGAGAGTGVLVVTVLTSMDLATASSALGRPLATLGDEVLRLAALAAARWRARRGLRGGRVRRGPRGAWPAARAARAGAPHVVRARGRPGARFDARGGVGSRGGLRGDWARGRRRLADPLAALEGVLARLS